MRWIKILLVSFFLGLYFLSITPIHFYAHNIKVDHTTKSHKADDCSYINFLQTGQGTFLDSDVLQLHEENFTINPTSVTTSYVNSFYTTNYLLNLDLRGPPQTS